MGDTAIPTLITGATAVASGLLGYGAARGQQLIEHARLRADTARYQAGREDEERQRVLAADEQSLAKREVLYLDYLRVLDEYLVIVVNAQEVRFAEYQEWWQRFQALDNQMDLFAAPPVVECNRPVYAELEAVSSTLHSAETFAADVRRGFARHREAFEAARQDLVAAMRTDITRG